MTGAMKGWRGISRSAKQSTGRGPIIRQEENVNFYFQGLLKKGPRRE